MIHILRDYIYYIFHTTSSNDFIHIITTKFLFHPVVSPRLKINVRFTPVSDQTSTRHKSSSFQPPRSTVSSLKRSSNAFARTPSLSITANIHEHHYPLAVPIHETIPWTRCQPSDPRVVDKRTRPTSKRSNWSDFVLFHPAWARLKMRSRIFARTGSIPAVKSSLAPAAPSVVRAVHQDESPGRRLFYYANTRRFHAGTPNAAWICLPLRASRLINRLIHVGRSNIVAYPIFSANLVAEMRFPRFTKL